MQESCSLLELRLVQQDLLPSDRAGGTERDLGPWHGPPELEEKEQAPPRHPVSLVSPEADTGTGPPHTWEGGRASDFQGAEKDLVTPRQAVPLTPDCILLGG